MNIESYFQSINLDEIERFISDGQEENLHLEFKTVVYPNYNAENKEIDKKNLSKALSGFANSVGGLIIWGIKAKENAKGQDIASDKRPIPELTKFLNILNRLEGQATTPSILGVQHKKIETSTDIGFIVTYVPESPSSPHMANFAEKRYYKRSGDSFYICEHFDIKDMFQRRQTANLDLEVKDKIKSQTSVDLLRYEFTLAIRNTGRNYAKAPLIKLEINEPFKLDEIQISVKPYIPKTLPCTSQQCTYLGGQDVIIYPEMEYSIDNITLEISKQTNKLPDLILDYIIVAENMEKQNFTTTIEIDL